MSDALSVARLTVARERPYYSAVLWALQPVPTKDMAKIAVGGIGVDAHLRLYYDPEYVEGVKPAELAATLVHEIGHVLRNHAARVGDRTIMVTSGDGRIGTLWNVAADCEINDDLKDEGLAVGPTWVFPATFKLKDGLMAEEYYDLLQQTLKESKVPMGAGGGKCGSCADGHGDGHEKPAEGDDKTPAGVSSAESELIRKKVAEDVQAHVKNRGTVPAWLERWANEKLKSRVDWRRLLRALIRRACGDAKGKVDFTYRRMARRQSALPDFVVPGMTQPTPHVAVVVDTSGSMSATELAQALAEIAAVLEASGQRSVSVISCDAAIHTSQKVFRAADVKLGGGGGTDMRVGVEAAEALRPAPDVIILVTDGETPYPDKPTRMPLIVARTQHSAGYAEVPSWARLVDVTPDEKKDA